MNNDFTLPELPITAGGHNAAVRWDETLETYSARIDLFDWIKSSDGDWTTLNEGFGCAWSWLRSPGGSPTPVLVVGDRPGQHFTIDSLRNELSRRGLPPDASSWSRMLAFRDLLGHCIGDVAIVVSAIDQASSLPLIGILGRLDMECPRIRVEVHTPKGSHLSVAPRLLDVHQPPLVGVIHRSVLEVAASIVDLVWAPSSRDGDAIAWELAYEVIDPQMPFSLLAGSIADWIAHGSGLRWVDSDSVRRTGQRYRDGFRQLTFDI